MGISTQGYVLRAPRTAPSNATTTDEAVNGVCETYSSLPAAYQLTSPDLVSVSADQYRAAVLLREDPSTEFLIWAANTSNLGVDSVLVVAEGSGAIPVGTLTVANTVDITAPYTDGTPRLILTDDSNRTIDSVILVEVTRGDNGLVVDVSLGDFNLVSGVLDISGDPALQELLGGGFSSNRGDRLTTFEYTLAPPTFWWTKNDRYELRFAWNGARQRWEPLKGTAPRNLGVLLVDETYTLSPAPVVPVGEYLPGDSTNPDSYSMVRVGSRPDSTSIPVAQPVTGDFGGLLVVTDEEAEETFDFSGSPTDAGVVGETTGQVQWNPLFLDAYAGQTVFYSYQGFVQQDEIESLGFLRGSGLAPLFLAPIPGPTDYPFVRVGSRTPLEARLVETDSLLSGLVINEGQVGVSLSTGRLKFSSTDLAKTDPEDPGFDKQWVGAQAFYNGVSLTQVPVPLRAPVALVDSSGTPATIQGNSARFIPDMAPLPSPGVSGVMAVPDKTGTLPNTSSSPGIRPNPSGLVREIRGPWDLVLFGGSGQFRTIQVVDEDSEIPKFAFKIPKETAIVDLREGAGGSQVYLSREDQSRFAGEFLYFRQSGIEPSTWYSQAQMVSRVRQEYTLTGTERFAFRIDASSYVWEASALGAGAYTPAEIVASLNSIILGDGSAVLLGDRVALRGSQLISGNYYGEIEIGFGPNGDRDLSGCAALGFLPGWLLRVSDPSLGLTTDLRWLPDNGTNLGVFRSPLNLNGQSDKISDLNHIGRFNDRVLQSRVAPSPLVILAQVPLEDVAGYDEGVFFKTQRGFQQRLLDNFEEVYYEFGLEKFSWATVSRVFSQVEQPTSLLDFGQTNVVPDSLLIPGNSLRVSNGGPFETQELGVDFDFLNEGIPGLAQLINTVGAPVALGGRGSFVQGGTTFTDPSADVDFVALGVKKGYQLQIQRGDALGTYLVTEDAVSPNSLEVSPPFPASGTDLPWELFEGIDKDTYDPGIVADVVYTTFNHLPEDPFRIRVLSGLGDLPQDAAAQTLNRLKADMADALRSGRQISIRFGRANSSPSSTLIPLTTTILGTLANEVLFVPGVLSDRFLNDNFSVRVNTKTYTFADSNLVKVGVLTPALAGDVIEVLDTTGLLNFGTEVFTQYQGSSAVYVEEFLTPSQLQVGTTEYQPTTGLLNFSAADMALYGGTVTYFVELMVTANNQDVTINAIQGSFAFTKPLREFQIVEVDYFLANSGTGTLKLVETETGLSPVRIIEFLPLFVREEVTTPLSSGLSQYWGFNPTERTTRADIETLVWIGGTLTNIGSSPESLVEFDTNRVNFKVPVSELETVKINYAVLEAFGGEETYTTSQQPIYRPPFRIETGRTSFELEEDRTEDIYAGQLFRLGAVPLYITSSTYNSVTDVTTVEFVPETTTEIGSRNAADESLALLSGIPLAKAYNPNAPEGFWQDITAPFEPINRGFVSVVFEGNLTSLAVPGHVLELGGLPFMVASSSLSEDGSRTQVTITSPFPQGFAFGLDAARISVRPIYPPGATQFLGRGGIFDGSDFELILFGESNGAAPGRTLRPSLDYNIALDTGEIEFLNPPQGALLPGETLYLRHTQVGLLSPFLEDGVVIAPAYSARFTNLIVPSQENGLEGSILRGTYTFANPDSFFYRTIPLLEYIGEVATEVAAEIAARLPSQGPAAAVPPPATNATQGRLGLKAQLSDLLDQDRAARVFLEFYNETIVAFEQIQETISGNIVGDRDGKFRFFVGRDKDVPPPGFEDSITGRLNPRNAFSEVFSAFNPAIWFLVSDPVVDPATATLLGNQVEGAFPDSDLLGDLIGEQRTVIKNDVDDLVLVGRTRKRIASLLPFKMESFGRFRRMGEPNRFSRIFPERSQAFTQLDPGIQSDLEAEPVQPGVYSFRKRVRRLSLKGGVQLPKRASTFRKSIGQIENPVLGQIENIASVEAQIRFPRARIFAYSDTGFPEFDADMLAAGFPSFTALPRPAVIATVLPLQQVQLGGGGLPDLAQWISQGGDSPDLTTGDPDLFTPPFVALADGLLPMVAFGNPDGRILDVATAESFSYTYAGTDYTVTKKVFVGEVALGCVLTFVDQDGVTLTPGQILEVSEDPAATNPPIALTRGDTIFVTPPDADVLGGATVNDPPTQEQKAAQVQGMPGFRIQFDLGVDHSDGEFVDRTLPSLEDPSIFGLKEIFGQEPPKPLSFIDADVRFRNSNINPAPIPALTGGFTNDSGDYSLPYLFASNTEIDRLGEAAVGFLNILTPDSPVPNAVFPDEVLGADGVILGSFVGLVPPATLLTSQDLTPVTTAGAYVPHSGIGDVRGLDLLLVEAGQAGIPNGAQGMLSVGAADTNFLETPRFVTPTVPGDRFRYRLRTAMSYMNQAVVPAPATPGMIIDQTLPLINRFDLSSLSAGFIVFNDGSGAATGGLNNIFNPAGFPWPANDNEIRIHLWTADVGGGSSYRQSVVFKGSAGAWTAQTLIPVPGPLIPILALPTATSNLLTVSTGVPIFTIAAIPGPGDLPENPLNPGFSVALWFTVDVDTSSLGVVGDPAASTTGSIGADRLTFMEALDMRGILPRDELKPDLLGPDVFSELEVLWVTGGTTDALTVNNAAETNGGSPFTFVRERDSFPLTNAIFDSVFFGGLGMGGVKVPAWEGFGNTPIVSTSPVTFSAIPSSEQDETGIISEGTASAGISGGPEETENFRLLDVTLSGGSLAQILPGDVCVISGSDDPIPKASSKTGTYLVKHAITPNNGLVTRDVDLSTFTLPFNTRVGWVQPVFPTVSLFDVVGSNTITVVESLLMSDGVTSPWATTGTLYILTNYDQTSVDYYTTNFKINYTAVNTATGVFTVDPLTATDFNGTLAAATAVQAIDNLTVNTFIIAGFVRMEVRMDRAPEETLPRNTVGSPLAPYGFSEIELTGAFGVVPKTPPSIVEFPAVADVVVKAWTPIVNGVFVDDSDAVVYDRVPLYLELNLPALDWDTLHGIPAVGSLTTLLPGDVVATTSNINEGFRAQAGIFLEPSVPQSVQDLAGALVQVVDASHSLPASNLGFRDGFGETNPELTSFQIRRIRRFHDQLETVGQLLEPLKFTYLIRRGTVTSFGSGNVQPNNDPYPYVIEATGGTQLGFFDNNDVNINPGDMFRLFDSDGVTLLDEAEIGSIEDGEHITLKTPGITALSAADVAGKPFEIYLRTTPVPHEQSNNQLLEQITDQVLVTRARDFATQQGGWVPVETNPTDPRQLRDTDATFNFATAGVVAGDILVIDPAGLLEGPAGFPVLGPERAARPFGDRSVPERLAAQAGQEVPFQVGAPSPLDDNRGWYRITEVLGDSVVVSSDTEFTADPGAGNVTFGSEAIYAVYPTVSGSTAPFANPPGGPGVEGQMDLRPTAFAGTNGSAPNSFAGNLFSIAPFAYRIFRPSPLFSSEAVDLILMHRERILSWVEEFEVFFRGDKYGSYFVFQRDQHISDLGNPLIPDEGKGVISNALIEGAGGLVGISPFANTTDCLSVLDRRFWANDFRLDGEFPPFQVGVPSYATLESNLNNPAAPVGDGRPVLPDRIDDVLNNNDQFRELRFSWLEFRVNRETGTLETVERFARELPKRRQKELNQLRVSESVESLTR